MTKGTDKARRRGRQGKARRVFGAGLGGHPDGVKQPPHVPWERPATPNRRGNYVKGRSDRSVNKAPSRLLASLYDVTKAGGSRHAKRVTERERDSEAWEARRTRELAAWAKRRARKIAK